MGAVTVLNRAASRVSRAVENCFFLSEPLRPPLVCSPPHSRAQSKRNLYRCSNLCLFCVVADVAQRFFAMQRLPAREGYEYNPMVLYLDDGTWDPGVPLGLAPAKRVEMIASIDARPVTGGASQSRSRRPPPRKRMRRSPAAAASPALRRLKGKHESGACISPSRGTADDDDAASLIVNGTGISPGGHRLRATSKRGHICKFSIDTVYGNERSVLVHPNDQTWTLPAKRDDARAATGAESRLKLHGVADTTRGSPTRTQWAQILSLQDKLQQSIARNVRRVAALRQAVEDVLEDPRKREDIVAASTIGSDDEQVGIDNVGICRLCGIAGPVGVYTRIIERGFVKLLPPAASCVEPCEDLEGFVHAACEQLATSRFIEDAIASKIRREREAAAKVCVCVCVCVCVVARDPTTLSLSVLCSFAVMHRRLVWCRPRPTLRRKSPLKSNASSTKSVPKRSGRNNSGLRDLPRKKPRLGPKL